MTAISKEPAPRMTEVEIERREGAQLIRLARPEKKNALTGAMYTAIIAALADGDRDPAVAAHVVSGVGGDFTAGNDIADFLAHARTGGALSGPVLSFIRALPRVEKPLIAAVDGLAVGIGTTLLFHCDLVVATARARFRTPFLDLGLVPEAGSSVLGPARMGYARAFELLVLGETFDADAMAAAGIVNRIVPEDRLEAEALAFARRLAAKPPEALALSRRLMRGDPAALVATIDTEARIFAERLSSVEAREAFEAFLAKRAPDFAAARARATAKPDGAG